jgi:hypothetical protein
MSGRAKKTQRTNTPRVAHAFAEPTGSPMTARCQTIF